MERAILVTIDWNGDRGWETDYAVDELRELTTSAGADIAGEITCRRDKPTAGYMVGKGKAEEVALLTRERDAAVVIFNEDLSFTQQRNLEDIVGVKVIDRTQLILDIFAQRAKSLEGKVQVELAQLVYLLPRLSGKGILLSRLGGGIGTRGPGEMKLEVDRRRIRKRIAKLRSELDSTKRHRQTMRKERLAKSISTIAIIGYTNAGKSTLLNTLTNSSAFVKDQLFSTLDPLSRRYIMPNNQKVLFVDTVGFLHRLPHHLIESFKATLEEVVQADILIHILDISSPRAMEQNDAVFEVLSELNARNKPIITALNKIDLLESPHVKERFLHTVKNSVAISALKGTGIDALIGKISAQLSELVTRIKVLIPPGKMRLANLIYNEGEVTKREDREDGVYLEATVPVRVRYLLEKEDLTK